MNIAYITHGERDDEWLLAGWLNGWLGILFRFLCNFMRIHKILAIWNVLSSSLLAAAVVAALKVMVPKQNKRHFSYGKQEIFATPMLIYIFMPDCMPDDALHFISYIMRHSLCCIVVQSSACRKYASDLKIFFYEIGNAIGCCHRYITRQRKIDLQFSSRRIFGLI